ncbi:cupin domain-containing protein [Uliginosibacterium sediminicola]|uniref:Cupin domain-containing protein n=1 Tax=Uliginosibacterium sediminicola TaxID=2024550 RepID=A0ABU9YX65_9RHOO
MSFTPISLTLAVQDMHAIGSVENLGSTVLSGDVQAWALGTFGAPTDPVSAGYFAASQGSFRMTYPFNEQATVVQGSVKLTDVTSGESRSYGVGDSWFVTKGTEVIWEIDSPLFMKHYFAAV